MKRSWVEVDLEQIKKNYFAYKKHIAPTQKIMAVVKANAYGHGDIKIAEVLAEIGVEDFAVSNVNEAIRLRDAGIKGQILILGYTPIERAQDLYDYDITQALISRDYAEKLSECGLKIKAQFAIDTGMKRIGLNAENADECEKNIRLYASKFDLTGIFTHLCVADTESEMEFTKLQILRFKSVCDKIKDLDLPYIHCMNSAGGMWQEPYGNLVRLGIILYGLKPDYENTLPEEIKPALQWKSVVAMVKDIFPGDSVGYGRSFKAEKRMKIATVPTGYADGYNRLLSNKGYVVVGEKKAPIIGRVCMDQLMIDVSDIENVQPTDEVELLGGKINADDMGKMIDTIGYEVVCDISERVERFYKRWVD